MNVTLRIAVLVVWAAVVVALFQWDEYVPMLIGVLAVTVLAGALVARWWALAAPVAVGVVFLIGSVTVGADDSGDEAPIFFGILSLLGGLLLAAVMAAGVGLA